MRFFIGFFHLPWRIVAGGSNPIFTHNLERLWKGELLLLPPFKKVVGRLIMATFVVLQEQSCCFPNPLRLNFENWQCRTTISSSYCYCHLVKEQTMLSIINVVKGMAPLCAIVIACAEYFFHQKWS